MRYFVCTLILCALAGAKTTGTFTNYTTSEGRQYYVYVPLKTSGSMVVFLHGTWTHATVPIANKLQWEQIADQYGPVIVWPISTLNPETNTWYWNCDGCDDSWFDDDGPDDLDFIASVISTMQGQYGISPGETFVSGMSSGGYMTQLVGDHESELVAAIAPVSGAQYIDPVGYQWSAPILQFPVSVYRLNGDLDMVVPYCGGTKAFWHNMKAYSPSMDGDLGYWSGQNQCSSFSQTQPLCTNGLPTEGVNGNDATGCLNGSEVLMEREVGYGHQWVPGTELKIWAFFQTHGRAQ